MANEKINENYEFINELSEVSEKIDSLRQKYPDDEKVGKLVSALQALHKAIEEDISTLAHKPPDVKWAKFIEIAQETPLDSEEIAKISQSSAMVILKATNETLDKVFKEGAELRDITTVLDEYHTKCQKATEWPLWQKLVLGVIGAVISAVLLPGLIVSGGIVGVGMLADMLLKKADDDPLYALHLIEEKLSSIEKDVKQILPERISPKTTFFTPYDKLVSDVKRADPNAPSQDDQNKSEDKSAPDKTNTLR